MSSRCGGKYRKWAINPQSFNKPRSTVYCHLQSELVQNLNNDQLQPPELNNRNIIEDNVNLGVHNDPSDQNAPESADLSGSDEDHTDTFSDTADEAVDYEFLLEDIQNDDLV